MEAADEAFRKLVSELEKEELRGARRREKRLAKVSLQRADRLRQKGKPAVSSSEKQKKTRRRSKNVSTRCSQIRDPRILTRPLPGSPKVRSKCLLFALPSEIWNVLLSLIPPRDRVALALVSRSSYQKVWNLYLHEAHHVCRTEIAISWNSMAEILFQTDGKESSKQIPCSQFKWRRHSLKVRYVRNPMDVDVLSWYEEGNIIGYKYL